MHDVFNNLIVIVTLEMAHAILLEAALSFLGLGVQPPIPSWGLMVSEGKNMMLFEPWLVLIPGAVLFALVLAINLIVVGVLAHGFIKTVLFESPMTICIVLIVGGFILLWIDRLPLKPRYTDVMDYPPSLCLKIGLFQVLAMVPGTSRSGATIVGALLMGTDKRSAAEFSFFLAMPTMAGAFAYDLFQNRALLTMDDAVIIATGFITSFIVAVIVVRMLLDYVSRYGFGLFAWWRIIVGSAGLVGLWLLG